MSNEIFQFATNSEWAEKLQKAKPASMTMETFLLMLVQTGYRELCSEQGFAAIDMNGGGVQRASSVLDLVEQITAGSGRKSH